MVRYLGIILVLALLLCGCAGANVEVPESPENPVGGNNAQPPVYAGLYMPQSTMEQATAGAVKTYTPQMPGYYGCAMVGTDLLMLRLDNGETVMNLYRGEDLQLYRTLRLGEGVTPEMWQIQVNEQGIGYFDSANKAMAFLNEELVEIGRMYLPEDIIGGAWLSPNWKTVIYCTEQGIWVMDLQSGISRLLHEQSAANQRITGGFGNGEALRYEKENANGQKEVYLIDGTSGMVLQEGDYLNGLSTCDGTYFIDMDVLGVRQLRFGQKDNQQILWPLEDAAEPHIIYSNYAVVMAESEEEQTTLSYYDLATGHRINSVVLPNVTEVWAMSGDGQQGVWLFGKTKEGTEMLYLWNVTVSEETDEKVYTTPQYTAETADEEALKAVAQEFTTLGDQYGVSILTWKDAIAAAPADYVFTEEYMAQSYEHYLPILSNLLKKFPKSIYTKGADAKLQIVLVQSIAGEPAWGGLQKTSVLQYWNKNVPVIALVLDENVERSFYHGMYHYMETRILSNSSALYEWNKLNPSGFAYDNSYTKNLNRTDRTYVDSKKPYFIDMFSMSYAKEDRARIFEYACMSGNEALLKTPVLQQKIQRICKGIRTAFGLTKEETQFLWEQYLNK